MTKLSYWNHLSIVQLHLVDRDVSTSGLSDVSSEPESLKWKPWGQVQRMRVHCVHDTVPPNCNRRLYRFDRISHHPKEVTVLPCVRLHFFFILLKKRTRNVFPQKHFLATSDGEKSVSKMRFCTKQYNLFNQNTYKWLLSRLLIIFLERKLWNFIWIIEDRTNVLKILILNLYVTILHNLYVFPIVRYI